MNQELVNKLIARYHRAIFWVNIIPSLWMCHEMLYYMKVHKGVCYCAYKAYDKDIYHDSFINSLFASRTLHWYPTPGSAETKAQIIERLQYRIDKLKTFGK